MRTFFYAALTLSLVVGCTDSVDSEGAQPSPREYLSNLRQITFGGQNAEAYWSPDGEKLVFQATGRGSRCDQIYVMGADGTNVQMVSTGNGVTTCGYFLSDNQSVVYASTHLAGDECPPRPDRSKGYVWPVHAGYDIFLSDTVRLTEPIRLTETDGYDAEATVNWANDKIVYTSKASGDLELWTMDADGSNKTQITDSFGYDGGAFFSRDGQKLVLRANHPSGEESQVTYRDLLADNLTAPMKMELFIANADGSEMTQITSFGCASFAPQFTPDGKSIIFSSNKNNCDSREFDLFLIDLDGSNLRQVTDFGGFTSFAEFAPNGKRIVFSSDRDAKDRYEFNIFVADWESPLE